MIAPGNIVLLLADDLHHQSFARAEILLCPLHLVSLSRSPVSITHQISDAPDVIDRAIPTVSGFSMVALKRACALPTELAATSDSFVYVHLDTLDNMSKGMLLLKLRKEHS